MESNAAVVQETSNTALCGHYDSSEWQRRSTANITLRIVCFYVTTCTIAPTIVVQTCMTLLYATRNRDLCIAKYTVRASVHGLIYSLFYISLILARLMAQYCFACCRSRLSAPTKLPTVPSVTIPKVSVPASLLFTALLAQFQPCRAVTRCRQISAGLTVIAIQWQRLIICPWSKLILNSAAIYGHAQQSLCVLLRIWHNHTQQNSEKCIIQSVVCA